MIAESEIETVRDQLNSADVSGVDLNFEDLTLFELDHKLLKAIVLEFFEDVNTFRYQETNLDLYEQERRMLLCPAVILKWLAAEYLDISVIMTQIIFQFHTSLL